MISASRLTRLGIAVALVTLVLAVFGQATTFGFVNYDDHCYIADCPFVVNGLTWFGLKTTWTTPFAANYHPLTTTTYLVETHFGGRNPAVFHTTNVCLHAANVLLLYLLLLRTTGETWPSAFVAALFAVHPLNVQPVAWATSRKDVLSFFFAMLALLAYVRYARRPGVGRYAVVWIAYLASLLSKQAFVTLPFALLLLDFWPLRRWRPFAVAGDDGKTRRPGDGG